LGLCVPFLPLGNAVGCTVSGISRTTHLYLKHLNFGLECFSGDAQNTELVFLGRDNLIDWWKGWNGLRPRQLPASDMSLTKAGKFF